MADPAYNRVHVSGSAPVLKGFIESCCRLLPDGNLALDFDRIVPVPTEVGGSDSRVWGQKTQHWGTEWVCDFRTEKCTPTRLVLQFGSAGTPPEKVYQELAHRFPELKIVANFAEGANNFAHFFSAYRGEIISWEREATDEDWEAATGETAEQMAAAAEAARDAWEARNLPLKPRRQITHPRFWLRHWRVRRALGKYPIYDVPNKKPEGKLSEVQARENFDYFMQVRLDRLAFFQSWLRNHFSVDASLAPAGVYGVNDWVVRFAGGLIGDYLDCLLAFDSYEPRWEGSLAGCNVMIDVGIFMGEYIILKRPRVRWQMDKGEPSKPASSQSMAFTKPFLAGFPNGWTKDILQHSYGCIANSHKDSKFGALGNPTNAVLRAVKSGLYLARLPDGDGPFILGDSNQEQL